MIEYLHPSDMRNLSKNVQILDLKLDVCMQSRYYRQDPPIYNKSIRIIAKIKALKDCKVPHENEIIRGPSNEYRYMGFSSYHLNNDTWQPSNVSKCGKIGGVQSKSLIQGEESEIQIRVAIDSEQNHAIKQKPHKFIIGDQEIIINKQMYDDLMNQSQPDWYQINDPNYGSFWKHK